jgi:hypothetical protein
MLCMKIYIFKSIQRIFMRFFVIYTEIKDESLYVYNIYNILQKLVISVNMRNCGGPLLYFKTKALPAV